MTLSSCERGEPFGGVIVCEPQLRAPKTELRSGGRVCGHPPSDRPRDFAPSWPKQRLLDLLYATLRVPAPHRDVAAFMAHVQGRAEAAGAVAVAANGATADGTAAAASGDGCRAPAAMVHSGTSGGSGGAGSSPKAAPEAEEEGSTSTSTSTSA